MNFEYGVLVHLIPTKVPGRGIPRGTLTEPDLAAWGPQLDATLDRSHRINSTPKPHFSLPFPISLVQHVQRQHCHCLIHEIKHSEV